VARSWFRSLFARPAARTPAAPRLAVNRLEDREVPAVLWVNVNDPTADAPGDNLYAQIQGAVDAAAPGDVIKVHAGTYAPVTIAKSNITVQEATPASDPVIDAGGGISGLQLTGSGVTLLGLTVRNTSLEMGEGFQITGDNNRLFGNAAADSDVGFSLVGATGNLLQGNTANGNFVGFSLADADGNTLVGNTANGNFAGFALAAADGNRFVNNTANGNVAAGFWVTSFITDEIGSNGNEFVGNTANQNGVNGFRIVDGANNGFVGNTADGNGGDGFYLRNLSPNSVAVDNVFIGNRARGNGGFGVYVEPGATGNIFYGTVLAGNEDGDSNAPLG
jgi:parallel beta-helix repeat protein